MQLTPRSKRYFVIEIGRDAVMNNAFLNMEIERISGGSPVLYLSPNETWPNEG